jgi:hypothetical protein
MDGAAERIAQGLEQAIRAEADGYHFYMVPSSGPCPLPLC